MKQTYKTKVKTKADGTREIWYRERLVCTYTTERRYVRKWAQKKFKRLKLLALDKCNWRCQCCGRFVYLSTLWPRRKGYRYPDHIATLDHVERLWAGGDPFVFSNVQILCMPCHAKKSKDEVTDGLPGPLEQHAGREDAQGPRGRGTDRQGST